MDYKKKALEIEKARKSKIKELEAGMEFYEEAVLGNGRSEDSWKRFLQTGKVEDYLDYTARTSEEFKDKH